jgi:hypothetical protein
MVGRINIPTETGVYELYFRFKSPYIAYISLYQVVAMECKLVFKEEEDGPEIYLLDSVNLSEEEEDKIPKNSSYPTFCVYKFPDIFNGIRYWTNLKKGIPSSGIAGGSSLISNNATPLACGKKYHVTCHRYQLYKEKLDLKRKHKERSDYMEGMAKTTDKHNRLIETRGPTGVKQSQKIQTIITTCQN